MSTAKFLTTYNTAYNSVYNRSVLNNRDKKFLPRISIKESTRVVAPHIRYVSMKGRRTYTNAYQTIPLLLFYNKDYVVEYSFGTWLQTHGIEFYGEQITNVYYAYIEYTKTMPMKEIILPFLYDRVDSATLNRSPDGSICWGGVCNITMDNIGDKFLSSYGNDDLTNRVCNKLTYPLEYTRGMEEENILFDPDIMFDFTKTEQAEQYNKLMKLLLIQHLDKTGIEQLKTTYRVIF